MRVHFIVIGLLLSGAFGCAENLDPTTPEGAMNLLRDSVMARDVTGIREASSAATSEKVGKLHSLLAAQEAEISTKYPADYQATAYAVIAKEILSAKGPDDLFIALVTPQLKALETDEGLQYGMSANGAHVSGNEAKVTTQSRETIDFVLEGGTWKTTAFERNLDLNIERAELNARTMGENLKVLEELKRRAARKAQKAGGSATTAGAAAP